MAARGYTTRDLVAAELGRTLTADQQVQADGLIEEAEAYVDRVTGKAWLTTSPATAEAHRVVGGVVYLDRTPVVAITTVTVRTRSIGSVATTLTAGSTYELIDAVNGLLAVGDYGDDAIVTVTYTHANPLPVPADVRGVTTRMVANRMRGRLDPSMAGVKSVSVGQGDLAVTYREADAGAGAGVSEDDLAILRSYAGIVFA